MILDAVDYHDGNQDNYWVCYNCNINAIEKIRYIKRVSVKFDKEEMEKNDRLQ